MEIRKLTYQLDLSGQPPEVGQYLVTLSQPYRPRQRILSVMVIKTVRKIIHRTVTDHQAYRLELINRPDLKPFTEFELATESAQVWVRGEAALPCFWIRRGKPN